MFKQCYLNNSLDCPSADLEVLFYDQYKRSIDSGISIVAFENKNISTHEEPDAMVLISSHNIIMSDRSNPKILNFLEDYGNGNFFIFDKKHYIRSN